MKYCCIHVTLYVLIVSPLLCNVDVMISTLQKRLQDALLSLVGPSSSFRIGSHLGRDNTCPLVPFEDGILLDPSLVCIHRCERTYTFIEEESKKKRTSTPFKSE